MSRASRTSQTPANKATQQHTGTLFFEGIPKSTKSAFKSACADNEVTMRDAIIDFMRDYAAAAKQAR